MTVLTMPGSFRRRVDDEPVKDVDDSNDMLCLFVRGVVMDN